MERANKLLYIAFGSIMFCAGIFILISSANNYKETLEIVRQNYKDDIILYQQFNPVMEDIVTYPELIAMLYSRLEYDIEINGVLISKDIHSRELIQNYGIRDTDYIKSYEYNEKGEITKIAVNANIAARIGSSKFWAINRLSI
jgi:hypothetical protein